MNVTFWEGAIPVVYYSFLFFGPMLWFAFFIWKRGCRFAWNTGFADGYKSETISSRERFHKVYTKSYEAGVVSGQKQKIANQELENKMWGTNQVK